MATKKWECHATHPIQWGDERETPSRFNARANQIELESPCSRCHTNVTFGIKSRWRGRVHQKYRYSTTKGWLPIIVHDCLFCAQSLPSPPPPPRCRYMLVDSSQKTFRRYTIRYGGGSLKRIYRTFPVSPLPFFFTFLINPTQLLPVIQSTSNKFSWNATRNKKLAFYGSGS